MILHVDMDAFFASASLIGRPDLVGQPVVVGGGNEHGVILAATYAARAFGVRSAMPVGRARRLCPHLVVVQPDFERYQQVSGSLMQLFEAMTPSVQAMSMEEAFLDVSRCQESPVGIAQRLRDLVSDEQGITCSVGVAATKLVAKMASRAAKPDGLRVVLPSEVTAFLHPLPVEQLYGVGARTHERLVALGLRTVGDLAHAPVASLRQTFGPAQGGMLHRAAWGLDDGRVVAPRQERTIGAQETFGHDVDDASEVHRRLLGLSERVTRRSRAAGLAARRVTLTVRYTDFRTITRSRSLPEPSDVSREIYLTARELYDGLGARSRLRLVGVRMGGLTPSPGLTRQLRLDEPEHGWADADRAIDRASARFGTGAVRPASLLGRHQRSLPTS